MKLVTSRQICRVLTTFFVLGSLAFMGCADDPDPEEAVIAAAPELPATPPEDNLTGGGDPDFQPTPIYFAFDDYTLGSDAQSTLNQLADFLKNQTSTVVQVEGHCDERGSIEYNLALGERRAQSVKNYLVQLGIDSARLPTLSYGEEKPAEDGSDESSWRRNRRAEFVISNP